MGGLLDCSQIRSIISDEKYQSFLVTSVAMV
jgi:hypothetical protein